MNGERNWSQETVEATLKLLDVRRAQGLTDEEALQRTAEVGPNELRERTQKPAWRILWEQVTSTLIVVLLVAAVVSVFLGDFKDAAVILAIVVLNAIIGFQQEFRAENAMAALRRMALPKVHVRRAGHLRELPAVELTLGDIVILEAGSAVPADGRLLESANLRIQEAALTGESEPVDKQAGTVYSESLPLGDQANMAFLGTSVTQGRGEMAVVAIGMQTELGRIANLIQTAAPERTPLQRRLDQLAKVLALVALGIVAVIFAMGIIAGEPIKLMFMTAVSMAVAAVPEGLPAVVTIALAVGAQRMLGRQALIRKLPAVETLGSVTVICSDKTGTLTKNQMTVTVLDVAGRRLDVKEELADGRVQFDLPPEKVVEVAEHPALAILLAGGALCNDAVLELEREEECEYQAIGDPTEGALVIAAAKMGLSKLDLDARLPRVGEIPFDSQRKRMTTVHRVKPGDDEQPGWLAEIQAARLGTASGYQLAFTKGAVDGLLNISNRVWDEGRVAPLDESMRTRVLHAHDQLAADGMRVLGVAFRPHADETLEEGEAERELIFVGLAGMMDPPRDEVRAAVAQCREAGIRPLMITGDHPLTARHIAEQLGIDVSAEVVTGQQIAELDDAAIKDTVTRVSVFARVAPEHKLRLVRALEELGEIVAMTGDGVNDAPALKQADIGVAMGMIGTDVAQEASDMVLRDDNFATIVAAVEEGRVVYDNVRKFIRYTLTSNFGEIVVMLVAPLLGMPLPLLPLQILWINL
ncbi:MAG: HAD-IC family P-type ATPase, partial [Planctomycetales bacterium]|nr:HAD-IC family P-type ATPase [Planctomycetales bacterium]